MSFSQMTTAAFSSGRKNVKELLATARKFFGDGSGNKRKQSRPDARCAHNWTSPVTSRSEQPTPVTRFAITCETSTAPSKNKISYGLLSLSFLAPFSTSSTSNPNTWLITRRRDLHPLHPDLDPTSSTRLGSSLTISGARERSRWL